MRTLAAIAYFFLLGYFTCKFEWDQAALRAAGRALDQIVARAVQASEQARRELEADNDR